MIMSAGPAADRIRQVHRVRFANAVKALDALLKEIRKYEPEANIYLDDDHWNLMVGPSHAPDAHNTEQRENVAWTERVSHSGGGGW